MAGQKDWHENVHLIHSCADYRCARECRVPRIGREKPLGPADHYEPKVATERLVVRPTCKLIASEDVVEERAHEA